MNIKKKQIWVIFFIFTLLLTACKNSTDLSENELEQKVFHLINDHRISKELNKLEWNDTIAEQCRIHSSNMASGIVPFSHDGFQNRLSIINETIPYSRGAENVAYTSGYSEPAEIAYKTWIHNEEHKINIEGNYNLTGVGVAKNDIGDFYFTQIFILSK